MSPFRRDALIITGAFAVIIGAAAGVLAILGAQPAGLVTSGVLFGVIAPWLGVGLSWLRQ